MEGTAAFAGFAVVIGVTLPVYVWAAVTLWRRASVADRMTAAILGMRLSLGNERVARGWVRAFVPTLVMMAFVLMCAVSGLVGPEYGSVMLEVGLAGVALSMLLAGIVGLFARPKFLVPPHMRRDRSLFARDE
ncbi:hypothetical protein APR03_000133 [Promicromonospora thailandica]|uniref:Uncharacterized protein n=2 Tax=Promicromonospora thailandica TaxID=765201 RepID=A0A9X2FWV9_9MICO|nr:hypothetical protein [Promicromonospora thailandica]BFF18143.1 hypothetical protein GCM10025730_16640 [Promicromonospora thailandica]